MFKSKIRALIIPQYEHQNLAGTLASAWGNAGFDKPSLDFDAFVRGVALHDWHYGVLDTLSIGEANEAEWLAAVRKGVRQHFDHPVTDVIVKLHIQRLLSNHTTSEAREMSAELEQAIQTRLAQSGQPLADFEWADRITSFCDHVAFAFSFEKPTQGSVAVHARAGSSAETRLEYAVQPTGMIRVRPWPFAGDTITGILLGYQAGGYPQELVPEVIRYEVMKG